MIEALLVPMRTPSGTISTALVADPALLEAADPLAPVLPVNAASLVGRLSARTPRARIGAVLRACELRALVELTKVQQACLEDLTLIALDCAGTYPVPLYERQRAAGGGVGDWCRLYRDAEENPEQLEEALRLACKICEQPVYSGAAISFELFGSRLEHEIRLALADELGERLGLSPCEPVGGANHERAQLLEKLVAARTARMEAEFAALWTRLEGGEGLLGVFAACIRCHNCMTVCPICYCKTCVFMSALFDHDPRQYIHWAEQKGAIRLPADTMLFHLTRMNHMALSCVGCGMCTEACPADLPVGLAFRAIGQRLGAVFGYAPGRSPDEPLPLSTFKADEWMVVGEK
jgi:formate dehydrogenase subunit beta